MATKATKKPAKKSVAKKAATKKTPAKKSAAKKSTASKSASKSCATMAKKCAAPVKVRKTTSPKNKTTGSFTQSEFLENVKNYCGLEKKSQAKELCEDLSLFIQDSLKKGYKLPLLGLGKMYVRKTKARMGRNPATGEVIKITAKKRVRFTPAKSLKESVL